MLKIKKGRKTITNDLSYIAGFVDGEGCIRIKKASQRGNSFYVWVAITNTYKPTLDYIAEIFGGKVRKAERKTNKWAYHFLITSSEAVDFLKSILGFLREKRPQAELAIKFHEQKETLSVEEKCAMYEEISRMKR